MRLFVVATLLLALAVSAVSGATNTVARSLRLPAGSVTATAGHPLVGDWLQTTAAGPVHITFGADGSVIMRFPDIALSRQGTSFVSGGTGTWEPVGERGAAYTVVRLVSYSNGIDLGTITIRGYLVVSEAGSDYTEDAQLTTVTTRDAVGAIVSVAGAADDALATTATRIEVVGSAVPRPSRCTAPTWSKAARPARWKAPFRSITGVAAPRAAYRSDDPKCRTRHGPAAVRSRDGRWFSNSSPAPILRSR